MSTLSKLKHHLQKCNELLNGKIYNPIQNQLCKRYYKKECQNCPICISSGNIVCHSTHLHWFIRHFDMTHNERDYKIMCNKCKWHIKEHIKFIEGIIKEYETKT